MLYGEEWVYAFCYVVPQIVPECNCILATGAGFCCGWFSTYWATLACWAFAQCGMVNLCSLSCTDGEVALAADLYLGPNWGLAAGSPFVYSHRWVVGAPASAFHTYKVVECVAV